MTNRDPHRPDFIRKVEELYQCVSNYVVLKNSEEKLLNDLTKPDIDLVCNYELYQLRQHYRENPWGLTKSDLVNMTPSETQSLEQRLRAAHGLH